jgi:hypothetical protein
MTEDHFSAPDKAWKRGAISSGVFFSSAFFTPSNH